MEAEASQAGVYRHGAAWVGGVVLAGVAVVTASLCGTIAVLVRNAPAAPGALPIGADAPAARQWAGFAVLLAAAVGFAASHAASQERRRLPGSVVTFVLRLESVLGRVPPVPMLRGSLTTTREVSRLVAVIGPFASSAVAAAGTWLAVGLGWRALFVGGALAGAAAAGAAILVEPQNTSIQSGGMAVALVVGALAGFGWTLTALVITAVGAVWVVLVAETTDAVVRRGTAWVTLLLGGVALTASSVLSELDNTLASLTVSGTRPRTFGSLAPLVDPLDAPGRVEEVAATWLAFRRSVAPVVTGGREVAPPSDLGIRSLYALVDSAVFALAVSLLLIAACLALLQRLATVRNAGPLSSILTVARFTVPVLFAVDVAENLSGAAAVLPHGLSRSVTGSGLDGVSSLAGTMAVLHWFMAVAKWTIVAGAVVALVASALTVVVNRRRDRADSRAGSPLGTAWRSLRAHVVIVVVLALAVRGAQAMDAIRVLARRESIDVGGSIVLVVAVAVCAIALRYLAELVGREVGHLAYAPDAAPAPTRHTGRRRARARSAIDDFLGSPRDATETETDRRVWFGAGIGAVGVVMALFLDAPGLLIPVAIWLVIELLSIPLRPVPQGDLAAGVRRGRALRRLVVAAGAVAVLTGAAWLAHLAGGAAGVRWLLAALGVVVAAGALTALVTLATLRRSWFGLRPLVVSGCGVIPFCRVFVPAVARRCVVAGRWFGRSFLRRLVLPVVWLLRRIGAGGLVQRCVDALRRGAPAGPTASGAGPSGTEVTSSDAVLVHGHASAIAAVIGGLVPMIVGAAVVRSALGPVIYAPDLRGGTWLLVLGVGLVLAGPLVHGLPRLRGVAWGRGNGVAAVSLALATLFVAYLVGWQTIDPPDVIASARALGAIGVLCVALAMFALIASTIAYLGDATESLPSLRLVRINRSPFFAFAIAWFLIAGAVDGGGYHAIDTGPAVEAAANRRVTARSAFEQWAAECASGAGGRQAVPMVFVAATGGGIRAAYWTASTLQEFDRLVDEAWGADRPCSQPIFAASGASGGSVGIGTYAVHHLTSGGGTGDVTDRLDEDYLSPTVAWMLMADVVRPFFLWDGDGDSTVDRAAVLERALQSSWPADGVAVDGRTPPRCGASDATPTVSLRSGLRETWCLGAPLVILNGAEVNSACRFNTSVLDNSTAVVRSGKVVVPSPASCRRTPVGPGSDDEGPGVSDIGRGPLGATIDLDDYLCGGEDVSMATAVMLSARFPYVTPSGRVTGCDDSGLEPAYVVDGGYLDNSGAASLVELWAEVSTYVDTHNANDGVCIVPMFVQIDNGYEFDSGTSPSRPSELTLPLSTVFESRGSRESEAKQVAASIFTTPSFSGNRTALDADGAPVVRWKRIVPEAHPGVQAPLGWVLSAAAQADLDEQLREEDLALVRTWLDPALSCG